MPVLLLLAEVAALILAVVLGTALATWIDGELPVSARLSAGFGLGSLAIAASLFALLVADVPLRPAVLGSTAGGAAALAWLLSQPHVHSRLCRDLRTLSGWRLTFQRTRHSALVLMCLALVCIAGGLALFWPVYTTDALILFDSRARLLAMTGSLERAALLSYDPVRFASYPPLTTMLYAWVYAWGGLQRNPQYFSTLYTAATALALYALVRQQAGPLLAAGAALALLTTRTLFEYATNSYTVAPAVFYAATGLLVLDSAGACSTAGAAGRRLLLAGLLLGGAVWARVGFEPHVALVAGLALWLRRGRVPLPVAAAALLLPALLLAGSWWSYARLHLAALPPHPAAAAILAEEQEAPPRELLTAVFYLSRLPLDQIVRLVSREALRGFWQEFAPLIWETDRAALVCFMFTAILSWRDQRERAFLWGATAGIFAVTAAGHFLLYLVYPRSLQDTSASVLRLQLVVVPLLLYGAALNIEAALRRVRATRPSTAGSSL